LARKSRAKGRKRRKEGQKILQQKKHGKEGQGPSRKERTAIKNGKNSIKVHAQLRRINPQHRRKSRGQTAFREGQKP